MASIKRHMILLSCKSWPCSLSVRRGHHQIHKVEAVITFPLCPAHQCSKGKLVSFLACLFATYFVVDHKPDCLVSVLFSSVQDGIEASKKAHMLSTPSRSVQFSSRWHLSAWESPYGLHPISNSSVQFKMASKCSRKPIWAPLHLDQFSWRWYLTKCLRKPIWAPPHLDQFNSVQSYGILVLEKAHMGSTLSWSVQTSSVQDGT